MLFVVCVCCCLLSVVSCVRFVENWWLFRVVSPFVFGACCLLCVASGFLSVVCCMTFVCCCVLFVVVLVIHRALFCSLLCAVHCCG